MDVMDDDDEKILTERARKNERERERLVFLAKVAEQAERYHGLNGVEFFLFSVFGIRFGDKRGRLFTKFIQREIMSVLFYLRSSLSSSIVEMVESMKKLARLDVELTPEERHLLSVGYKNLVGARRESWRILTSLEQKEEALKNERNIKRIREYLLRVEEDLAKICNEILSIIAIHILPSSIASESIVFFYKMKGDYYRYLAEFRNGEDKKEAIDQSLKAYQAATSTSMTDLAPAHPIRLGLALNFSVFYYEILHSTERALGLAKQAFEDAITEINDFGEDSYKDSILIMQIIKENLTIWASDLPDTGGGQAQDDRIDMEE